MGSVVKFAAVNTKIRVLESKFLNKQQIKALIDCKSYKETLQYLKESTNYGEVLKHYNLVDIHRGELELILKKSTIQKYNQLIHYLNGDFRNLLKILFIKLEVEDLKVIIRGKYIGKTSEEILPLIICDDSISNINFKELILTKSIEVLVEKLKDTIYYKHISNLAKDIPQEGLFRMEMTLDFIYFICLRKFVKKLSIEDRKIIEQINGIQADLLNLQWILRGKKYYELTPEVLFNYTIHDSSKLKKDDLKKLCYTKSLNEFYEMVEKLPYGELFSKTKGTDYLIEKEISAYLKNIYKRLKRENKMNISVLISYLELELLECRDIISIVENKRYNQQSEEIFKYITATL